MEEGQRDPAPLYYTFGNHMHWVDMEWLWGYGVLPGSVHDMLDYCEKGEVRGNINFDAAGYERLAVESPNAFARLREAVDEGTVEIVGASYGQPYGLFHGGESNIRQRVHGVRTVQRLFGVRPRMFWEEEFDFFPQLPQMLVQTGYSHASLFFQWTWHTPTIPEEQVPAIRWCGVDGSTLLTATKNRHSVHQWPEDLREILAEPDLIERGGGLVQWLELMPSPDWMCRSELMLPLLKELRDDSRFELRPCTLREYLDSAAEGAPQRVYGLGDVFHGMSLGKNGDLFRRLSREAESTLLSAESVASVAGSFGRPYPHWDAYPTWEIDESWRELLLAQHHDNDECEGLCGFVGKRNYERAIATASTVVERSLALLGRRAGVADGDESRVLVWNPLGWARNATVTEGGVVYATPEIPGTGYAVFERSALRVVEVPKVHEGPKELALSCGETIVKVDRESGTPTALGRAPEPVQLPTGCLQLERGASAVRPTTVEPFVANGVTGIRVRYKWPDGSLECRITIHPDGSRGHVARVHFVSSDLPVLAPKYEGALSVLVPTTGVVLHDHPHAVTQLVPSGEHTKKYPTGDWMTSEQEYETLIDPVTALSFYDFGLEADPGSDSSRMQLVHNGSQAGFMEDNRLRVVLSMNDPWDEAYFVRTLDAIFFLRLHDNDTQSRLRRAADELLRPVRSVTREGLAAPETGSTFVPGFQEQPHAIPGRFSLCSTESDHVCITAVYRESGWADLFPSYAGRAMNLPLVIRLVEFDAIAGRVNLRVYGRVASVARTNLLGERIGERPQPELSVHGEESIISFDMKPHEITTLYVDVEEMNPVPRNLDEHRGSWAHAHRVPTSEAQGDGE